MCQIVLRFPQEPFVVRYGPGNFVALPAERQNCNRFAHAQKLETGS